MTGRDIEAARFRLDILAGQVRECVRCDLAMHRKQTVFGRGNPTALVMFVGEGPGADENETGQAFAGRAGQLLDRMILAMGLAPEDVYLANVVCCQAPGFRSPTAAEIEACLPRLHQQIDAVRPQAIVALGATAAKALVGSTTGIRALRGHWRLYSGGGCCVPVMPTFHPAYLLREHESGRPEAKREAWTDLQAVMERLGRPVAFGSSGL